MNAYDVYDHEPCHVWFDEKGKLWIENATMGRWSNFKAAQYGGAPSITDEMKDLNRTFKVFIDDEEMAKQLNEDGFSISMTTPDAETGKIFYLLKIKVSYRYFDPIIVIHNSKGKPVGYREKDTVAQIDEDPIIKGSLNLRLRTAKRKNDDGMTCYLEEMHYMIEDNPFSNLYGASINDESPSED